MASGRPAGSSAQADATRMFYAPRNDKSSRRLQSQGRMLSAKQDAQVRNENHQVFLNIDFGTQMNANNCVLKQKISQFTETVLTVGMLFSRIQPSKSWQTSKSAGTT